MQGLTHPTQNLRGLLVEQLEKSMSEKSENAENAEKHDKLVMDCGCEFEVFGGVKDSDGLPKIKIDYDRINYNCDKTWNIFREGRTLGVFQLEGNLGQQWSEETKPANIDEIAELVSIIRPGVLNAKLDGKSMTKHYADRKNGKEENKCEFEALSPILNKTQNVILFQETIIRIASEICGFSLEEADSLRKSLGKKLSDKLMEVKQPFVEGAEKIGYLNSSEAEKVFEWILASSRYSFNQSHATSYAIGAYWSAYAKAHFPKHFNCTYMTKAKDKQTKSKKEQIREIVRDGKSDGIEVLPPDLRDIQTTNGDFYIKQGQVYYGLKSAKSIGDSSFESLKKVFTGKDICSMDFLDLLFLSPLINKSTMQSLIKSGAVDFLGVSRRHMLFEHDVFLSFSNPQVEWMSKNKKDGLIETISYALEYSKEAVKRKDKERPFFNSNSIKKAEKLLDRLLNPCYNTDDNIKWTMMHEKEVLGVVLSVKPTSGIDTAICNTNCLGAKEHGSDGMIFLATIASERTFKIKNGQNAGKVMCVLNLEDEFGCVEAVLWPDVLDENEHCVFEGNNVIVFGKSRNNKQVSISKLCQA
jgi:DNA polymerase-3 subunit alpha